MCNQIEISEIPPCFDCPLACNSWADMLLCEPGHYLSLVGRYYGTGSSKEQTCAFGEEVLPFD